VKLSLCPERKPCRCESQDQASWLETEYEIAPFLVHPLTPDFHSSLPGLGFASPWAAGASISLAAGAHARPESLRNRPIPVGTVAAPVPRTSWVNLHRLNGSSGGKWSRRQSDGGSPPGAAKAGGRLATYPISHCKDVLPLIYVCAICFCNAGRLVNTGFSAHEPIIAKSLVCASMKWVHAPMYRFSL
jgi:hypothetical protein